MADVPFHEAAQIFPLLEGPDFENLCEDIRENGLLVPIELFEDKILDGRNRYRACLVADVEPDYVEVEPEDPVAYIVSLNLHRRHLSESQRTICAAKAKEVYAAKAKQRQGTRTDIVANCPQGETGRARDQAGKAFKVSGKGVDRATKVLEDGVPELIRAVENDQIAVSTAAKLAKLPKAEQKKAIKGGKEAIKAAITPPKPPPTKPKYPATEQFLDWLTNVSFGMGMIKEEYGSLTKMVKGSKWDKAQTVEARNFLQAVTKGIHDLNQRMQGLCQQ